MGYFSSGVRATKKTVVARTLRHVSRCVAFGSLLAFTTGGKAETVAVDACSALVGMTSDTMAVTSASMVPASQTVGGRRVTRPFCRAHGVAKPSSDSVINFEVWLPAAGDWSGRLKVDGTGGFAGAIPVWNMVTDVAAGFAAAGSDMGHVGGESADWTIGHPEKVKDWGFRAHYSVTTASKAIAESYYGRPAAHTYFEGCSNGGRQGMMMAERYPTLFDGIIAGAPSMFYPVTLMSVLWTGYTLTPVKGQPPVVSPEKLAMVGSRAHEACDAQDGLVDQQITNPLACKFDPSILQCSGAETPDCLTFDQLHVMQAVYRGVSTPDGVAFSNGPLVGSEAEWGGRANFADTGGFDKFLAHFVYSNVDPSFNPRQLDLATEYDRIKQALRPWMAAPSPDLSQFQAHGGKLIQYQGWTDPVVSPRNTLNYAHAVAVFESLKEASPAAYDSAVGKLTAADVAAADRDQASTVQKYYRLFMMPDIEHCGGGTGPATIEGRSDHLLFRPLTVSANKEPDQDVVLALVRWVEQGVAPDAIIASKVRGGTVVRQRPLCVYPNPTSTPQSKI